MVVRRPHVAYVVGSFHEPSHCRYGMWLHAGRLFHNDAKPGFHEVGSAGRVAGHRVRTARGRSKDLVGAELSHAVSALGPARYQPQTVSVRPEAEGATAAAPRLAPNPVHMDLQAVAKKKRLVATAARLAATAPMASTAPMAAPTSAPALTSAPSTLTEMAPSATNYPWSSR